LIAIVILGTESPLCVSEYIEIVLLVERIPSFGMRMGEYKILLLRAKVRESSIGEIGSRTKR
jgi:hypothetical protein